MTDAAVQQEANDLRRALGLHTAQAMKDFLSMREIDIEVWSDYIETIAYMRAVRGHVVTEEKITETLVENRDLRRQVRDQLFGAWKREKLSGLKFEW